MTGHSENLAAEQGRALAGLAEAHARYDAVLCDIWGVLHNGEASFADAAHALFNMRRMGRAVTLITNAPRPRADVAAQLAALGVTREAYDSIATSGDVCAELIAARAPARAYHLGAARDLPVYQAASIAAAREIVPAPLDEADFVVCTGLVDDTVETPADYENELERLRARNLPMICANPDLVVHRGEKLVYCAGALAERYAAMGGHVEQAGKPYAPIYRLALGLLERARNRPLDVSRVLAIGDAMHTDIAGASAMGLDSLLITGGIHRAQLHGDGDAAVDAEAYKQFTESHGVSPTYRMDRLVW
jgi:HAD superfamily hydrolase (TIGR01459 family)